MISLGVGLLLGKYFFMLFLYFSERLDLLFSIVKFLNSGNWFIFKMFMFIFDLEIIRF